MAIEPLAAVPGGSWTDPLTGLVWQLDRTEDVPACTCHEPARCAACELPLRPGQEVWWNPGRWQDEQGRFHSVMAIHPGCFDEDPWEDVAAAPVTVTAGERVALEEAQRVLWRSGWDDLASAVGGILDRSRPR
ncbi:MAG: hypothetical protein J2P39_02965 [Candidatus Dormibacteraeota bacterium]|nr:hypothetical protein [Candidatus Dormibacteraeota bacterium]